MSEQNIISDLNNISLDTIKEEQLYSISVLEDAFRTTRSNFCNNLTEIEEKLLKIFSDKGITSVPGDFLTDIVGLVPEASDEQIQDYLDNLEWYESNRKQKEEEERQFEADNDTAFSSAPATAANPPALYVDISEEEYREYHWADGYTLRIEEPAKVNVTKIGGHNLIDKDGVTHYIQPGWRHVTLRTSNQDNN